MCATMPIVVCSVIPCCHLCAIRARLFVACGASATWRGQRLRAILAILLDTGVRQQELLGLQLGDVDLESGDIRVRPMTDKTRKGRTIALGRRAKLELSRWWTRYRYTSGFDCSSAASLFVQHCGKGITRDGIQLMLKRLGKRADVPGVHPHRFRHTFAHEAKSRGMSDGDLMVIAGWQSPQMLHRYGASAAADRARDSHRRLFGKD